MELIKPDLTFIKKMQELVKEEVLEGRILFRSDDEVATNIRSYIVAVKKGDIVGYGALHIHSITLAEIRSLVVKKEFRGKGIGTKLVEALLNEAKQLKLKKVFALTYHKSLFLKLGFIEIDKKSLPDQKIWQDCIRCKHFPICDEVALLKNL